MDPSLSVRSFVSSDAAPLTELLHSAYAELGAMGLNFTAVDQSVETTLHRAGGGQCWVVERRSELVATLTMSLPPSQGLIALTTEASVKNRAWLNQVAVSPDLRHSGIAAHLWELGRTWAGQQGATSIGVDTAEPAEHLLSLYRRWGFRAKETIHWSGKTYDSVVMIRPLEADDQ
jgi:GNAT superfamily N-acetyltransferase